ncbi:biotin/lipoyl-binding protein [Aquibium sp. A9E412]|uniref:ATP-binding protein n=1 Tax=Aquibium sp. A9E412 TaxID=2976767 RepID=UPI0025AEF15B|nr:biotin carboxylase N-terminal domain-containing protein [Aquibium sp. A9E412]MDN2568245.1 biotin/lipoyl-binding protein [Aquibium sp. A9E412]
MSAPSKTPFATLLVANRGEIALRVMRSARALGLRTVAVFSDADAGAPHVRAADLALPIGPAAPAQSYLSIDAILQAARAAGADAVHPGYGFLAENADFAAACAAAGLVFVGPRAETIRTMGDKAAAKRAMAEAGVSGVPGYDGADQSDAAFLAAAGEIGYPLMVKAVAGGGGRGMRRVAGPDALAEALRAARGEAAAAFGDPRLMLETAIADPRHVEIQVFGDRHGNAIHLGERDCSIQRRNQKLIEEAPSPALDDGLRAAMGAAAVRATRALGYEGAGTFEFLLDADGRFHFMEMNTRLQVEHPVTEALTGLDLVALQLRVAAGEPLGLAQGDVRLAGHAIEARICAEDEDGFVPQSGRMARWAMPAALRVDSALEPGAEVPPHYDSLIAKLVAHGPTREAARRRLADGLRRAVALGVTTNIGFLARCLEHPDFVEGRATTGFVAAHAAALARPADGDGQVRRLAALLLRLTAPHGGTFHTAGALLPTFAVPVRLALAGAEHGVSVTAAPDGLLTAEDGDGRTLLRPLRLDAEALQAAIDGVVRRVALLREGDRLCFMLDGETHEARDLTLCAARRAGAGRSDTLLAPMSGRVSAVHVAPGDRFAARQALVAVEAMKMEHDLSLPAEGTVAEVLVAPGQQVSTGQLLLRLEPAAAEGAAAG